MKKLLSGNEAIARGAYEAGAEIGAAFYPDGTNKNAFRIACSRETEDVIGAGIRRLAAAVRQTLTA